MSEHASQKTVPMMVIFDMGFGLGERERDLVKRRAKRPMRNEGFMVVVVSCGR